MEQCPQCKENTLVYDSDEFGEFCFCTNKECNFEVDSFTPYTVY
jgi:hypothetical protein